MTWEGQLSALHAGLKTGLSRTERLEKVSRRFLGTPYCKEPVGGSPGEIDPPGFSLDCFDCATYVETAIAVALSTTTAEYIQVLTMLRYERGSRFWADRLHYFSLWLDSNEAKGMLEILPPKENVIRERKALRVVPGFPVCHKEIEAHPWDIAAIDARAGIIGFVSQQVELDVFHVGIVADGGRVLRHASASAGEVIEEPLSEFLEHEEGGGVLMARLREAEDSGG
jgi:hypothetical protein